MIAYRRRLPRAAAVTGALALAFLTAPASALPGQTVAQFTAWAHGKPLLAKTLVAETDGATHTPRFEVSDHDPTVSWYLRVQTDGIDPPGAAITREVVSLHSGKPGEIGTPLPILHGGTGAGFATFSKIFGADIAADYKRSALVAAPSGMSDAGMGPPHEMFYAFFRGARFSYIWNGGPQGQLIVQSHAMADRYDAKTIQCIKSPRTCTA